METCLLGIPPLRALLRRHGKKVFFGIVCYAVSKANFCATRKRGLQPIPDSFVLDNYLFYFYAREEIEEVQAKCFCKTGKDICIHLAVRGFVRSKDAQKL